MQVLPMELESSTKNGENISTQRNRLSRLLCSDIFPTKQSIAKSIFEALIHPLILRPQYDHSFTTPSTFSPSIFSARDLLTEFVTPPWLSRHNGRPETALSVKLECSILSTK